ncbi:MAG: MFS transporter [Alphaproteobacteria bacterium]|nr:MFS transporter [Alphaproteobacteria bacterium]
MTAPPPPTRLFARRDFRLYLCARGVVALAMQVQTVAVGWQVYEITGDPLALGYVGLALFLPAALCSLPAGDLADRFDRRRLAALAYALQAIGAGLLLALTLHGVSEPGPVYAVLVVGAIGRAVSGPAQQSYLPLLMPAADLPRAVAATSATFKIATIVGPAVGGILLVLGPAHAYAAGTVLFAVALATVLAIRTSGARPRARDDVSPFRRLLVGIDYVWRQKIILGAISLDLFAVLLGGAAALLPIYARDILAVGPQGLGVMRSAIAIGGAGMGLLLTWRPITRRVGAIMLGSVGVFGVATVVFGVSTSFAVSLAALAVMGAADMVSVFVRQTAIQLATPDEMRGRVSSVNMLFIGASNELGDFESGVTAAWFGVVPAVVLGGLGTIGIVATWCGLFPALRRMDRFADVMPKR